MDAFVRTLSITSSQSVQDVTEQCARLINWLHCVADDVVTSEDSCCELNYRDIETMFKATLYLRECFSIYGEQLLIEMVNDYAWARETMEAYYVAHNKDVCVRNLCQKILASAEDDARQIVVSQWLHLFADIEPCWRECIRAELAAQSKNNIADSDNAYFATICSQHDEVGDVVRMMQLVQQTFQLPAVQIQTAVSRMLTHLPFSVLGQLFKVTPKCPFYNRCVVLAELVCQQLAAPDSPSATQREPTPSAYFIQAVYQHIGNDGQSNLPFFWQCLAHQTFAHSLMKYLLAFYAKHIEHVDLEWLQYMATAMNSGAKLVPLACILFLTHVLLATKSPCRRRFYALIKDTKYAGALMGLLNKVAFVYS